MNYELVFYRYFAFRELRKISSSTFFETLLKFVESIVSGTQKEKVYIFSGTKTNIATIMASLLDKIQILRLGDQKVAPLSAIVALEIWED